MILDHAIILQQGEINFHGVIIASDAERQYAVNVSAR